MYLYWCALHISMSAKFCFVFVCILITAVIMASDLCTTNALSGYWLLLTLTTYHFDVWCSVQSVSFQPCVQAALCSPYFATMNMQWCMNVQCVSQCCIHMTRCHDICTVFVFSLACHLQHILFAAAVISVTKHFSVTIHLQCAIHCSHS